jgi:hypothetical protein
MVENSSFSGFSLVTIERIEHIFSPGVGCFIPPKLTSSAVLLSLSSEESRPVSAGYPLLLPPKPLVLNHTPSFLIKQSTGSRSILYLSFYFVTTGFHFSTHLSIPFTPKHHS